MPHNHFIKKCICGIVINQCRCMAKDKTILIEENCCHKDKVKIHKTNTGEQKMEKHIDLLGKMARDLVTRQEGVITCISFDLYGCVQCVITPEAKDGKVLEGNWMDVSRIKVLDDKPVMTLPDFEKGYVAEGKKGCAEKPLP